MLCTEFFSVIQNNFCTQHVLVVFMYWTGKSMSNHLSYCGLVDSRISASDNFLLSEWLKKSWKFSILCFFGICYRIRWAKQLLKSIEGLIILLSFKNEVSAVEMSNFTTLPEKSVNVEVLRDFLFSSNEIGANMKNRCASLCYLVSKFQDLCDFHIYDGTICSLGNFHNPQRRRIANQPNGTYTIQYNKGSFSKISHMMQGVIMPKKSKQKLSREY